MLLPPYEEKIKPIELVICCHDIVLLYVNNEKCVLHSVLIYPSVIHVCPFTCTFQIMETLLRDSLMFFSHFQFGQ